MGVDDELDEVLLVLVLVPVAAVAAAPGDPALGQLLLNGIE